MSSLPDNPADWGPQHQEKIKRNLNRLYWIFFILALVVASYMVG